jgi:hypothetical protein
MPHTGGQVATSHDRNRLKHRKLNHAIFDVATCKTGARDPLELGTTFVEIAERLILCAKPRLGTARLPNRADRQHERNGLSVALLGPRCDLDTLGHGVHLLRRIEHQISAGTALFADGSQWLRSAIVPACAADRFVQQLSDRLWDPLVYR